MAGRRGPVIGTALIALGLGVVAAAFAGRLAPPGHGWRWWLVAAAVTALLTATRSRSAAFWCALCGVTAGLASCAFAAPPVGVGETSAVPVRFRLEVRDGWASGEYGWRTRVRLLAVEGEGRSLPHPREVTLYLGGAVTGEGLPRPGTLWEGSGELRSSQGYGGGRPSLSVKSILLLRPLPGGSRLDRLRERVVEGLYRAAGTDVARIRAAGLAGALVAGRREGLAQSEVASLRRSGLAHLLAVSGLHVGLVAALGWGVLIVLGVPPVWRRWLTVIVVVAFALVAGGGVPVRRAALAAVLYLVGRQIGRPLEPLPTVWGVVAVLVLLEPSAVLDAGFQLSAGVTLALVRWARPLAGALPGPRTLAAFVAVPVVAQAAAFPLIGAHFGQVAPLGVVANLTAAPLALLLVGASLLSASAAFVSSAAAGALLGLVGWLQGILGSVSRWAEGGATSYPSLPMAMVLALALLAVVALARHPVARPAAGVGVLLAVAWAFVPAMVPAHGGELELLPVRDGMALMLGSRTERVLVDAGRDAREASRALVDRRVRKLAAVVISHADADHVGGAAEVLRQRRVGALLFPAVVAESAPIVELRRLARQRGVREVAVVPGQRFRLGGMRWRVLWPPRGFTGSDNDASLAALADSAGVRVLVTGDLEARGELAMVGESAGLRADVLQLAHHGSRTSSTETLLQAVRPRVAVAATGLHPRFPYPHPQVAARVRSLPAVLLSQRAGFESLWWDDGRALMIGQSEPASVPLRENGRTP